MSIGEKLTKLRKEKGLSKTELGERVGICRNTIMYYENGKRTPKMETLEKIAEALGVDSAYFFSPQHHIGKKELNDIISIPVLSPEATACCGNGIPSLDITSEPTEKIPALKSYLGFYIDDMHPPFVINADGDSMISWGIPNGSKVVVNPAETVNTMDIALVCYWGRLAFKRVKYSRDNGVELLSSDGNTIKVSKDEIDEGAFSIWGKAMMSISKIKHGM